MNVSIRFYTLQPLERSPAPCEEGENMVDFDERDMDRTREQLLRERERLRHRYDRLFEATVALLFRHDPVGIVFEHNTDEYAAEAGTILPRLQGLTSQEQVLPIVYEEFLHWFGEAAGPRERYLPIARELWELWQVYQRDESRGDG